MSSTSTKSEFSTTSSSGAVTRCWRARSWRAWPMRPASCCRSGRSSKRRPSRRWRAASTPRGKRRRASLGSKSPAPRREALQPLSVMQESILRMERELPGLPQFNLSFAFRLQGPLNVAAFERSVAEIVRRHDSLRTSFAWKNGRPVASIAKGAAYDRLSSSRISRAAPRAGETAPIGSCSERRSSWPNRKPGCPSTSRARRCSACACCASATTTMSCSWCCITSSSTAGRSASSSRSSPRSIRHSPAAGPRNCRPRRFSSPT